MLATRSTPVRVHSPETRARSREERRVRTHDLLAQAHATDDQERREALLEEVVLINRGVAQAVASRYRNRGVPLEDLEQAAYEGLVKAVHRFDPTVRPDLLTYAVPTMRGEVQRWFRDQSWMVRPPRRLQEMQWKVSRSIEELSQSLGRDPSTKEISDDVGSEEREVTEALESFGCFQPPSLDKPVDSGEGTTLGDLVTDTTDPGTEDLEARMVLRPALEQLSERDRRILYLRFFRDETQTAIGAELGITQVQVSRLLDRIYRDLRAQIAI